MSKMLTIAQIALRENLQKRVVLYAAQTGRLKAKRVGVQGIYLVTEKDLAAWLASRVDDLPVYVKEN